MKKKWMIIICMLLLCMSTVIPVYGAEQPSRLIDEADILTDTEEATLLERLNAVSEAQGLDVVVVTKESLYGEDLTAFADTFYEQNEYNPDGILFLVNMGEREWCVSTAGFGITAFTDAGLDYMAEQYTEKLSDGQFLSAFMSYADLCESFAAQARTGAPYDKGNLPKSAFGAVKSLVISLVAGFGGAFFTTNSMKGQLKSVHEQNAAAEYVKNGSMNVTERKDLFLYKNVVRQKIEKKNTGGSSTHRSSSGQAHGGKSGKF